MRESFLSFTKSKFFLALTILLSSPFAFGAFFACSFGESSSCVILAVPSMIVVLPYLVSANILVVGTVGFWVLLILLSLCWAYLLSAIIIWIYKKIISKEQLSKQSEGKWLFFALSVITYVVLLYISYALPNVWRVPWVTFGLGPLLAVTGLVFAITSFFKDKVGIGVKILRIILLILYLYFVFQYIIGLLMMMSFS